MFQHFQRTYYIEALCFADEVIRGSVSIREAGCKTRVQYSMCFGDLDVRTSCIYRRGLGSKTS